LPGDGFNHRATGAGAGEVRFPAAGVVEIRKTKLNSRQINLGRSVFSLTPGLQPGVQRDGMTTNRFNGLPGEAVKTALIVLSACFHRAKATVLMERATA